MISIDHISPKLSYRRMLLILFGILGYLSCSFCNASALSDSWRRLAVRRTNARYRVPSANPLYPTPTMPMPDFDFMLSHSVPMVCPTKSTGVPRKMTLTDEQMLELLHANGGTFKPNLMAAARAAADQFPNLIPLTQYTEDDQNDRLFDFDPVIDNEITKQTLIEDLNKWSSLKQQLTNETRATVSSMRSTTQTVEQGGSTTPGVHGSVNQDFMYSTNNHQQQSAMVDQKLKSKLEQLHKQIEQLLHGNSLRPEGVMDLMNNFNLSIHPHILQGLSSGSSSQAQRVIRSTDGISSAIQYCRQKGNATADGFLHMCDECAVTTTLASDKFPRYINEIVCGTNDRTCLTVRGTPHGACKQTYIYALMLRRRPGGCRMMIQNGQQVLVDAWEIYNQKIRSGCECFINKRSLFAKYIGPIG